MSFKIFQVHAILNLRDRIKRLNNGKTHGEDNITTELLKKSEKDVMKKIG